MVYLLLINQRKRANSRFPRRKNCHADVKIIHRILNGDYDISLILLDVRNQHSNRIYCQKVFSGFLANGFYSQVYRLVSRRLIRSAGQNHKSGYH